MSFEVPPIGPIQQSGAPAPVPGGSANPLAGLDAAVQVDVGVPGSPPDHLREEMAAANRRVDELREQGRELHFNADPESGRIVIEVTDLDGNVIRTIPASKLLEVAGGAPLDD